MITAQENFTAWLAAEIQAAIDDPRSSIPHEEVMARMDAQIARLKEGKSLSIYLSSLPANRIMKHTKRYGAKTNKNGMETIGIDVTIAPPIKIS